MSINQSVLVPGRLITDSALVAFETFYYLNTKKTGMNEKLYGVEAWQGVMEFLGGSIIFYGISP